MQKVLKPSKAYVWLDTEFTTLKLQYARLLQVSAVVTDTNMQRLTSPADDFNVFVRLHDRKDVSDWIIRNAPGLVRQACSEHAVPEARVDHQITTWLEKMVGAPAERIQERPVAAGNSLHADWYLAVRYLPEFVSRLHYRVLDVSSLKIYQQDQRRGEHFDKENVELLKRYVPDGFLPSSGLHDAYYDVHASMAEFNYYRATWSS
jgi:oligoribonuclease